MEKQLIQSQTSVSAHIFRPIREMLQHDVVARSYCFSQNEVKGQGFTVKDVKEDVEMASVCLKFLEWRGFADEERRIRELVEKLVAHYKIVLED